MQLLISLLIIAATAAVVYAIIKTNPNKPKPLPLPTGVPYEPKLPDSAPALHWSDDGHFMVEVMNESRYQATLRELAGDHGDSAAATPHVATLMPDDHNAYENEAVAVFIEGRLVGYLSQKASIKFRELLRKQEAAGHLSTVDAQVRGGALWQDKRLQYIVVLDLERLEK
ncbi:MULTISPECIES: hypothetical protein [unclassified Duganella]|uniref:hypothetical protein n=1 Tax=unclassified Duganella TaxID=2636909 RepID=UPI000883C0EC|nr:MULTISPECIES: hypothetical protein [unclassified Duganella]SDG17622.1 hypothetical protein SAMN05216320_103143 [Duganella sp. OV458]SDJ30341.1 hypothetical protein SAMN05428973_103343 [Duganella sp. OV510]